MTRTLRGRSNVRPGWAAFGLIGLLLVMAIMLYLMFGTTGGSGYVEQVKKTRDSGKQLAVDINTRDLLTLIATHQMNTGELPRSIEELDTPAVAFKDPWGTVLSFDYVDERATPPTVIITSAGPDLAFGTEDDIVKQERLPF